MARSALGSTGRRSRLTDNNWGGRKLSPYRKKHMDSKLHDLSNEMANTLGRLATDITLDDGIPRESKENLIDLISLLNIDINDIGSDQRGRWSHFIRNEIVSRTDEETHKRYQRIIENS